MSDKPRILLVDDEEDVTRSLKAVLRKGYRVVTANSGAAGLEALEQGAFTVVVSDMRMPEMNGAAFLSSVRQRAPETTRILLTGQSDIESAVAAINEGRIYRFLHKPCDAATLKATLADAVEQHRLLSAERELLEQTLRRSVQVLLDMLGHVHPLAVQLSMRTREVVAQLSRLLGLERAWRFEIAAMLSHLGCLSLPPGVLEKVSGGAELEGTELAAWEAHPMLGADLIAGIPRLEDVARMIARQQEVADAEALGGPPSEWDPVVLGSELMRLAGAYQRTLARSGSRVRTNALMKKEAAHPAALLERLDEVRMQEGTRRLSVRADALAPGMILEEDLRSRDGVILAGKKALVSSTLVRLVRNYAARENIEEPILVSVCSTAQSEAA